MQESPMVQKPWEILLEKLMLCPVPKGLHTQFRLLFCSQNIHQNMVDILHTAAAEFAGAGGTVGIDIGVLFFLQLCCKGGGNLRFLFCCTAAEATALDSFDVLSFPGKEGKQGFFLATLRHNKKNYYSCFFAHFLSVFTLYFNVYIII